ncbi:MAG: hypothetical protein RBU23_11620 [Candidatus Auribacterota bacterium]|jgi:hypothetical protein|nr:hypothetical protein [Candidatus Auribacterota bacterium]
MKKLIAVVMLFFFAPSLHALTIGFRGTIIQVFDPDNFIDGRVNIGDTFSGSITYDFSSYTLIEHPNLAIYVYNTYPNAITVELNGLVFMTNPDGGRLRINVTNDRPEGIPDVLSFISNASNIFFGEVMTLSSLYWHLSDTTGTALSSLELPVAPPTLSDYNLNTFYIQRFADGVGDIGYDIIGNVTFAEQYAPIPEPMTAILSFIGFTLLGWRFRKNCV